MDLPSARGAMVDDQLRARGITDPAVLAALGSVPRELFVDADQRRDAYADTPLPIGNDQTISQPYIVAFMAEALRLRPDDRVLDVGTGSGYAAAVVATIVREVWSVERLAPLAERARHRLDRLGVDNVHVVVGDGALGLPDHAPFDAISVAAAAVGTPTALTEQLAEGGRLVVPVGPADGSQELVMIERHGDELRRRSLLGVRFVPLVSEPDP